MTKSDLESVKNEVVYIGVVSFKFMYDGILREVDNISVTKDGKKIIGMEMKKGGKHSHRIKTYWLEKCGMMTQIEPANRKDRP